MRHEQTVVIVGGGFSGVALAVRLLRNDAASLHVTLIEASDRLGRGVAYGTNVTEHVLNTRAERMSVLDEDPDHFVSWCRRRGLAIGRHDFAPRGLYGEYLEDALRTTVAQASPAAFTARLATRVTVVEPVARGFEVRCSSGEALRADVVVLATGHPPPDDPLGRWLARGSRRYLRNPWCGSAFAEIAPDDRILLIGTGLTMVDAALALTAQGHRGRIDAISRRGLLPHAHPQTVRPLPPDLLEPLRRGVESGSLRCALRTVRRTAADAAARGLHWQDAIDAMRASTRMLWRDMCAADRRRFLGVLRPYWDVHRHRIPHTTAARIAELRASGQLHLRGARLVGARELRGGIDVQVRARGAHDHTLERYGWIVNCTGPSFARRACRDLERQLLARGLLITDPLELGYLANADGAAFGVRGPVPGLFLLGPACRAQWWEHTAAQELRLQARVLSEAIFGRVHVGAPTVARAAQRA